MEAKRIMETGDRGGEEVGSGGEIGRGGTEAEGEVESGDDEAKRR